MKGYRVLDTVSFGPGQQIGLRDEQIAPRAHNLRIVKRDDKRRAAIVTVTAPIQFKVGEIIALDSLPKAYLGKIEAIAAAAAGEVG
jgi:hypothetical protein